MYVDVNYRVFVDNYKIPINAFVEKISKYQVGDIVWVREPAKVIEFSQSGNVGGSLVDSSARIRYLADEYETYWDEFPENPKSWLWECKGVPNGCTKTMARIFLKITDVRVERLCDITIDDVAKEGVNEIKDCEMSWRCNAYDGYTKEEKMIGSFENVWNKTAPKGYKWEDNPYVFVYEFERVK